MVQPNEHHGFSNGCFFLKPSGSSRPHRPWHANQGIANTRQLMAAKRCSLFFNQQRPYGHFLSPKGHFGHSQLAFFSIYAFQLAKAPLAIWMCQLAQKHCHEPCIVCFLVCIGVTSISLSTLFWFNICLFFLKASHVHLVVC